MLDHDTILIQNFRTEQQQLSKIFRKESPTPLEDTQIIGSETSNSNKEWRKVHSVGQSNTMHNRILVAVILAIANFFSVVTTTSSLSPPSESHSSTLSESVADKFRRKRRLIRGEHTILSSTPSTRQGRSAENKQDRNLAGEKSVDDNIFARSSTTCHCGATGMEQRHGGILTGGKIRPCLCDVIGRSENETKENSDNEGSKASELIEGRKSSEKGEDDIKSSKSAKGKHSKGKGDDGSKKSKTSKSSKGNEGVNSGKGITTSKSAAVKGNDKRLEDFEKLIADGKKVIRNSTNPVQSNVQGQISSNSLNANGIGNNSTSKASTSGERSKSNMFVAVSVSVSFLLIYVWNRRGNVLQEKDETAWEQKQHQQTNEDIHHNLYDRDMDNEYLSDPESNHNGDELLDEQFGMDTITL
eukprot:jgi/Psemu1/22803/gm1.22803_g